MARQKDVLTTGEVAEICNVAPRTVSKWFDAGQLHGYRIPGSRDRRIPMGSLLRFMKQHQIPMDGLQSGRTRVLVVESEPELLRTLSDVLTDQAGYDVETAAGAFTAGMQCERFRPHVMLLDVHMGQLDAASLVRELRQSDELGMTRLIATSRTLTTGQVRQLLSRGFDDHLAKPFDARQVVEKVEDAVAVIH